MMIVWKDVPEKTLFLLSKLGGGAAKIDFDTLEKEKKVPDSVSRGGGCATN